MLAQARQVRSPKVYVADIEAIAARGLAIRTDLWRSGLVIPTRRRWPCCDPGGRVDVSVAA